MTSKQIEPVAQTLEPWFETAFTRLPRPVQKTAAQVAAPFKWRALSPDRRRLAAYRFDAKAADEGAAHDVAWYDATLEAAHWFGLIDVDPTKAAMLMSGYNPNIEDVEHARLNPKAFGGSEVFLRLSQRFEDLAKCERQHRSLLKWLQFARASKLRYHPWIDEYVEAAGIAIDDPSDVEPTPVVVQPGRDMLATRAQLISAFGTFTGMDLSWFNNITDTPALLKARKEVGEGRRSHGKEPRFCPMEVMNWLMSPKRKKGRKFHSEEKPWELLEKHFPAVYAKNSAGDPRAD